MSFQDALKALDMIGTSNIHPTFESQDGGSVNDEYMMLNVKTMLDESGDGDIEIRDE